MTLQLARPGGQREETAGARSRVDSLRHSGRHLTSASVPFTLGLNVN